MKYFKYLIGYLLSIITFKEKSFVLFIIYFSVNIMLAGTLMLYNLYNYRLIILSCLPLIIIYEIYNYRRDIRKKKDFIYKVIFKLDKIYKIEAYLDTGNDLVEPKTNIPVVVVSKEINGKNRAKIPFKTINDEGIMDGIYCDKFYLKIDNKYVRKRVYLVSKQGNYEGLLNILLF